MTFPFSLLMSIYKGTNSDFLFTALSSVADSSLIPSEVVLVFDGPVTNEVEHVVNSFLHALNIRQIRLPTNFGLGVALFNGVRACENEWIARFDDDDICLRDRFSKQISFIENNPGVGICGGGIGEFSLSPDEALNVRRVPETHNEIVAFSNYRSPFNHMTVMFRKSLVERVGSYRECYLYEDYDLWLRLIASGVQTANLPDVLVYARGGRAMIKRRGGGKYLQSEVKASLSFYRNGYINIFGLLFVFFVRVPLRLVPPSIRWYFYNTFLRERWHGAKKI